MEHRIVAAACRSKYVILVGVRHWDDIMHLQHDALAPMVAVKKVLYEQGFIDNHRQFINRQEAWKVAEAAGQILRRVGGDESKGGTLYSENLY